MTMFWFHVQNPTGSGSESSDEGVECCLGAAKNRIVSSVWIRNRGYKTPNNDFTVPQKYLALTMWCVSVSANLWFPQFERCFSIDFSSLLQTPEVLVWWLVKGKNPMEGGRSWWTFYLKFQIDNWSRNEYAVPPLASGGKLGPLVTIV